jgi:hypothetical protein
MSWMWWGATRYTRRAWASRASGMARPEQTCTPCRAAAGWTPFGGSRAAGLEWEYSLLAWGCLNGNTVDLHGGA